VPGPLLCLLAEVLGPAPRPVDAALADPLSAVGPSRLSPGALVSTEPVDRVRHARESLPDLVAMRSGRLAAVPDAVAYPRSSEDVRSLLGFAVIVTPSSSPTVAAPVSSVV
jgi:alkyldihydroxyacetonephosphate synthase